VHMHWSFKRNTHAALQPLLLLRASPWLQEAIYHHERTIDLVIRRSNNRNATIAVVKVILPSLRISS
jgi:hypothetical protein